MGFLTSLINKLFPPNKEILDFYQHIGNMYSFTSSRKSVAAILTTATLGAIGTLVGLYFLKPLLTQPNKEEPKKTDSDNDGLPDDVETRIGTDPYKPNPNVKYAIDLGLTKREYIDVVKPLDNDRIQNSNERQFVELMANNRKILDVPTFLNFLKEKASDGIITDEELKHSSNFASLVNRLYDEIFNLKNLYENNPKLKIEDPMKTIDYSSGLGLRLGFDKELATNATAKAIGYYGIAIVDRKLPENFDEISLLTKATQIDKYGDKLVDFSPIVFKSVDGYNFVLIPDAGRETWMLAKHMKLIIDSGFDITQHPEMFEGLNGKIIANAYSIFDAKYGINYIEQTLNGRTLKPTDNDVLDLIMLQWILYSNKAPQLGGGNKPYNRDFPWYDSDKLDVLYQDVNTRRQALLFLFHLDNGTFDMEKGKVVVGIEGAKIALIQAEKEYETISKLYPDGKIGRWNEDPRNFYYGWLVDRQNNGLSNTVYQYIGIKLGEYRNDDEFIQLANQRNAIDQYITKNWKYWDLVKFAMGYERWKYTTVPNMIERHTINYSIPQTLKAFGFPAYWVEIRPTPEGSAYYEWTVSLPDYIANKLKSEFNDKIIIGAANGFGLYFCKDGLIKDGISEIFGFSGGTGLLADKQPSLGLGWNFKFYLLKK
ncbi:MAG: thrombospondin type 3 repeat-containing protein [Candidatus Aenigmarchaeota archaeon]|nr:thrombospondin type 3 repeat-containing protein [Candidatus Aenigmarchaeota archaeon]